MNLNSRAIRAKHNRRCASETPSVGRSIFVHTLRHRDQRRERRAGIRRAATILRKALPPVSKPLHVDADTPCELVDAGTRRDPMIDNLLRIDGRPSPAAQ